MKNYKNEIEKLKKMLKYYGNVILVRECDHGIVLITEQKRTISFVERDGEIYHLVYQIVTLISQEGISFEEAFKRFEQENKNHFNCSQESLDYIKNILSNPAYTIKMLNDPNFPIMIQCVDSENNVTVVYVNKNSDKYKAFKIITNER